MPIKFMHINLNAKDWIKLSKFYVEVFNCTPTSPERNLSGEWIYKMTNINEVKIRGIHLSLPGYENGPKLEIFQFEPEDLKEDYSHINKQGYGHLAFHVDNVEDMFEKAIQHGGKKLGEIVKSEIAGVGLLTAVYIQDPEGNFIEIQNWS